MYHMWVVPRSGGSPHYRGRYATKGIAMGVARKLNRRYRNGYYVVRGPEKPTAADLENMKHQVTEQCG